MIDRPAEDRTHVQAVSTRPSWVYWRRERCLSSLSLTSKPSLKSRRKRTRRTNSMGEWIVQSDLSPLASTHRSTSEDNTLKARRRSARYLMLPRNGVGGKERWRAPTQPEGQRSCLWSSSARQPGSLSHGRSISPRIRTPSSQSLTVRFPKLDRLTRICLLPLLGPALVFPLLSRARRPLTLLLSLSVVAFAPSRFPTLALRFVTFFLWG